MIILVKEYSFCHFASAGNRAVTNIFNYIYTVSCKDAYSYTFTWGKEGGPRQIGYLSSAEVPKSREEFRGVTNTKEWFFPP